MSEFPAPWRRFRLAQCFWRRPRTSHQDDRQFSRVPIGVGRPRIACCHCDSGRLAANQGNRYHCPDGHSKKEGKRSQDPAMAKMVTNDAHDDRVSRFGGQVKTCCYGNPFAENTLGSSNGIDATEMISYNPPTFYSAAIVSRAALSIVIVMDDQ